MLINLCKQPSSWGFANFTANKLLVLWKKVWINRVKWLVESYPQFYTPSVDKLIVLNGPLNVEKSTWTRWSENAEIVTRIRS
jgi:hypothetical protein